MNDNDSQPAASSDQDSAVFPREPGHSHDVGALCRPEACTGHPAWKGAVEGGRINLPFKGQVADATYGGGFHPVPFSPGRVVDVATLEDRVNALEARMIGVAADEPCDTTEAPAVDMPGGRQARALAMLGTAETIRATGGAAEIAGIRLEACDEYGRTETTERLDRAISERDSHERAAQNSAREIAAMLEKLDTARAELEQLRRDKGELKRDLDKPRLGCATTAELIAELAARADVSATIGETWQTYRTVDSQ